MTAAFTIYWTPQGWKGAPEDQPLYGAAGTGFEGKISPGDRVFVTNVLAGKLQPLGAFDVDRILNTARDGKPPEASWDSREHLIARAGTATALQFKELSDESVKAMAVYVINRNLWALAALPLIFAAGQVRLNLPRGRLGFYVFYPVHLAVLWCLARLL